MIRINRVVLSKSSSRPLLRRAAQSPPSRATRTRPRRPRRPLTRGRTRCSYRPSPSTARPNRIRRRSLRRTHRSRTASRATRRRTSEACTGRRYESTPPNGAGAPEAEPEPEQPQYDDSERTQYVEPRPPAADATQVDGGGYEGYGEGGFPTYSPYPPPPPQQQWGGPPPEPYQGQPQYYAPPPGHEQYPYAPQQQDEQGYQQQPYPQQYAPQPGPEQGQPYPEQGQPYPGPQQYAPQPGPEQGEPNPKQNQPNPRQQQYGPPPGAEQGPPLAPLPDAYSQPPEGGQTADSLSAEMLLRGRRHAPAGGWRRALYKASGGVSHPGESPHEMRRRELLARARTPVAGGHHRVAVMSLKGGVGKHTPPVGLGALQASLRGARDLAVDANP